MTISIKNISPRNCYHTRTLNLSRIERVSLAKNICLEYVEGKERLTRTIQATYPRSRADPTPDSSQSQFIGHFEPGLPHSQQTVIDSGHMNDGTAVSNLVIQDP